jgi:hypothetical protein
MVSSGRQFDQDFEPAAFAVGGTNFSLVKLNHTGSDGQSESGAA